MFYHFPPECFLRLLAVQPRCGFVGGLPSEPVGARLVVSVVSVVPDFVDFHFGLRLLPPNHALHATAAIGLWLQG